MKTLRIVRFIVNVILAAGTLLVFNESDTFVPNFIGLACGALLIVINPKGDAWMRANGKDEK